MTISWQPAVVPGGMIFNPSDTSFDNLLKMKTANHQTTSCGARSIRGMAAAIAALALLGMAAFLAPQSSRAAQAGHRACVEGGVSFDGRWPIQFDRIAGSGGSKLYVHSRYPKFCAGGNAQCSNAQAYLLAGQDVAMGKTCGRWSYIEYVGTSRITRGWVSSSHLRFLRKVGNGTGTPLFRMTKGHGVPVCEAYLQRLNVADYSEIVPRPPYCALPENDDVPGFQVLHQVDLPAPTIVKMSSVVFNWWEHPNPRFGRDWIGSAQQVGTTMMAWRYSPPIDINNDGKPDDIILWQGYGLQANVISCGEPVRSNNWGFRPRRLPLIMNKGLDINTEETARIFGRPDQGLANHAESEIWPPPFEAVGHFITPFRYGGMSYFSAFFDVTGDYRGLRKNDPGLANVLGVLLRRDHKTSEVCEYRMTGSDFPPASAQPSGVISPQE